ncbi:cellobiose phosphorylase, partial [candidate division GN15 bacterium]|nr:cellobiose phosphorylase [candidate division GN15 bacterium]
MAHSTTNYQQEPPRYDLSDTGEFVIANYNNAKPFSSFFPGIAGLNGIPMWVFYVNRGQAISGMGIQDKDHPIMEFLPANWAYSLVTRQGFRTFLKISGDTLPDFYEPFQNHYRDLRLDREQRMTIAPSHMSIEEVNHTLNLAFSVDYFTVPQDSFAGLVRRLRIQNLGSKAVSLEGLDGLPLIVPYGVDNYCLKNMRRTIEAFVEVVNLESKAPFFKAKVEPADRPDVQRITRGNFYIGFEIDGAEARLIPTVVDPTRIFGAQCDYGFPEQFLSPSAMDITTDQILENQFPSAMGLFSATVAPKEQYTYASIIGHASSVEQLNSMIPRISKQSYLESAAQTNREIIEQLTQHNFICSGEPALDHYVRQNFLDNVQRGG